MKKLTERQKEVFNYIKNYIEDNHMPPTICDIKNEFEFRSPQSVVDHLVALEKKNYIKRIPNNSRGIIIKKDDIIKFPILGNVAAGNPLASEECFEGNFKLEDYYSPDQTFVLKVKGDSMVESGIYNGDLVLVKPQNYANHREIIVAVLNEEYTIKRFLLKNSEIILKPENPEFEPIKINKNLDDFRIIGKVVGVHRIIK